ncbi:MAG: SCO1664 family protein [Actinomycetota bacterium]|nr:SCO1664 family protein [Actinomycetota bacterium]
MTARRAARQDVVAVLETQDVEVLGLLPYSSNYVFLARVGSEEEGVLAIYKPTRGERPLWDFPPGTLAAREAAAYVVSEAGGWRFVPPTVLRSDGPLGAGSLQLFIEHDPERHYFVLLEERRDEFASVATFDIVVNNADRKAGHVLEDRDGRLWGVDHGLTFNEDPKLRTVIWDFAGTDVPHDSLVQLETLLAAFDDGDVVTRLEGLLAPREIDETRRRLEALLADPIFPEPTSRHHLPWPLV